MGQPSWGGQKGIRWKRLQSQKRMKIIDGKGEGLQKIRRNEEKKETRFLSRFA